MQTHREERTGGASHTCRRETREGWNREYERPPSACVVGVLAHDLHSPRDPQGVGVGVLVIAVVDQELSGVSKQLLLVRRSLLRVRVVHVARVDERETLGRVKTEERGRVLRKGKGAWVCGPGDAWR